MCSIQQLLCPQLLTFSLKYAIFVGLDDSDEALLRDSNETFRQVSSLEELFFARFSITSPEEGDGEWLMAMEIFNHLQAGTRDKLAIGKVGTLGRMLKTWNVPNKRVGKGSVYYLEKR